MKEEETLGVLVVDDSALYRKIVQDVLAEIQGVSVVGVAQNGKIALAKVAQLHPDLITLDIEMPEMDGLETLSHLNKVSPRPGVVVLSTHSVEGAAVTLKALDLGAFDFIAKPQNKSLDENHDLLKKSLSRAIAAFGRVKGVREILQPNSLSTAHPRNHLSSDRIPDSPMENRPIATPSKGDIRAVAIGVSTGGPSALPHVLSKFPGDFPVPVFIVQHMPPLFTKALAGKLNSISEIKVKEAEDGEKVRKGVAYLAPGGVHMGLATTLGSHAPIIQVADTPPINNCKPSVDHLFFSVAELYKGRCLGVIMTGMGYDGTEGLKRMKKAGAVVFAQDEASSVVYSMPRKPVEEGIVDLITPLDKIADEICRVL